MAEETKNPEVELDTDGVNEETINVEAPEVSDETFEKKQDVDLGYVDVSQSGKSAKELLQETKEEEPKKEVKEEIKVEQTDDESGLQDYSDKVQKRIKKLTFQVREAERREKAAIEYAKGLKTKYETAEQKYDEVDTNYLKEYDARIDAERDKAKSALKAAFDSQDPEQITEAQDTLTKLAVEKEKVSMTLGEKEAKKKEAESKPQEVTQEQPQISAKAQEWATDNEWFGSDRVMTSAAMGIHDELIQQGIDAETNEYYNQINKRMKEYFPQKFADATEEKPGVTKEPVQNVASVSRRAGGRKSVKLTKSQVVIAKKLGVPLEEYAKYVKEGA